MQALVATSRSDVKQIMLSYPMLSVEEEIELFRRWRENKCAEAYETIINSFARIAYKRANMMSRGIETDHWLDLFQAGMEGIMVAIPRFDATRNIRFSTFVNFYVRWKMQDLQQRNAVMLSGNMGSRLRFMQKYYQRLRARAESRDLGNRTLEQYIYEELNKIVSKADPEGKKIKPFTIHEIERYRILISSTANLEDTVGESGTTLGATIIDETIPDEEQTIDQIDTNKMINLMQLGIQSVLNEREMEVLSRRQLNRKADTLQAIASDLNLSKERIRQIESNAIEKLKRFLSEHRFTNAYLNDRPHLKLKLKNP